MKIICKRDVPLVPPSHKNQMVQVADPHANEIHLRQESKFVLAWLCQCFAHEQPRCLRVAPHMHYYSAADAVADTHSMNIGEWLKASSSFMWYGEISTAQQTRAQWPQLRGLLQPHIGCFESLAQFALAQCSWQCCDGLRQIYVGR